MLLISLISTISLSYASISNEFEFTTITRAGIRYECAEKRWSDREGFSLHCVPVKPKARKIVLKQVGTT